MHLLHRLSLSTKFLVLGVIALVMVTVPTGMYFNRLLAEVHAAKREAIAKDAVVMLNAVVQFSQTHRGLSAGALSGNAALEQRRPGVRDTVVKNMDLLDGELRHIAASSEAKNLWSDVRQRWTTLEQGVASKTLKAPESTKLHTQMINKVLLLNEVLLAEYGLFLDPEVDAYFLVQASLVSMPWLSESLGIMRAQGTTFLTKAELPLDARATLASLDKRARELQGEMFRSLKR
ncbi:MAG: nitrate- and nitrite sensing domain-containing protein, partial [Rhodoferax sp.]|nr:nitrate- and nitrite sensing domain-containing protein [Rhodoferax sp.]